jgi:hypothetical protein
MAVGTSLLRSPVDFRHHRQGEKFSTSTCKLQAVQIFGVRGIHSISLRGGRGDPGQPVGSRAASPGQFRVASPAAICSPSRRLMRVMSHSHGSG